MAGSSQNPLISAHKAESGALQVHLHPLVLLTISDYITRHTLRNLDTPIVGAILGQQNGREVTLEHAFECKVAVDGSVVRFDSEWFRKRVEQYKQVHKSPVLDIVGWFTLTPSDGPQERHLPIHRQLLKFYNESAILVAVHTSELSLVTSNGGKLPLTVYESVAEGPEGQMEVEGEDSQDRIRFRELNYSIETGEAEMISVDFVARGGGNATAVNNASTTVEPSSMEMDIDSKEPSLPKGKGRATVKEEVQPVNSLSTEDEELMASLIAKANAVKMLHSRIRLFSTYLQSLSPSNYNVPLGKDHTTMDTAEGALTANHSIMRSIQALVNGLPLLVPADQAAFHRENLAEKKEVTIIALLGLMNRSIKDMRDVGIKHFIVENQKAQTKKSPADDKFAKMGLIGGDYEDLLPSRTGTMMSAMLD
ncbi:MAG: hypothetical protein M1814_001899 [Vezdaea aestivalis]|nr:MAG: hypothetical protein M1814_001899 [Vezdaea aestivalis]